MPTTSEMSKLDMWVHANPNILNACRTSHMDPEPAEGDDDVDPEELKKQLETSDPYELRLKLISNDQKI